MLTRRRSRRRWRWVAALTVLVLALGVMVAYRLELGPRLGGADPAEEPAAVPAPPGLTLPETAPAPSVADPLPEKRLRPAAVRRAVAKLVDDPRLGRRVGVRVAGLDGPVVYAEGPRLVVPASTMKILTTLTALETLGPEYRFATTAVRAGNRLVLVGGGDPLLAGPSPPGAGAQTGAASDRYPERADLGTLARRAARELLRTGRGRVRLGYDATLFSGPRGSPRWEDDYLPDDVVSPISALWVDEGRGAAGGPGRVENPARTAASRFARALADAGVTVAGRPAPVRAPADAAPVAEVWSAELVEIVQHVLETSDNEAAEVLARHVALAEGRPGSFAGVSRALPAVAERLGLDMRGAVVDDGSGLARSNRLQLGSMLQAFAVAADPDRPELSGVLSGLPVAGWTGSLGYRFGTRADAGLGRVRAKTGTLTGVHGLAGVVTTADRALVSFAAVADRVPVVNTQLARNRLDRVAAALAACRCAR